MRDRTSRMNNFTTPGSPGTMEDSPTKAQGAGSLRCPLFVRSHEQLRTCTMGALRRWMTWWTTTIAAGIRIRDSTKLYGRCISVPGKSMRSYHFCNHFQGPSVRGIASAHVFATPFFKKLVRGPERPLDECCSLTSASSGCGRLRAD